jgi:hypothetical protein
VLSSAQLSSAQLSSAQLSNKCQSTKSIQIVNLFVHLSKFVSINTATATAMQQQCNSNVTYFNASYEETATTTQFTATTTVATYCNSYNLLHQQQQQQHQQ